MNKVDVDNALIILKTMVARLNDDNGKPKGLWYACAKQQDFLLKLADSMGHLGITQKLYLIEYSEALEKWERDGGVKVDEDGRYVSRND